MFQSPFSLRTYLPVILKIRHILILFCRKHYKHFDMTYDKDPHDLLDDEIIDYVGKST